jgi:hypothetical protein
MGQFKAFAQGVEVNGETVLSMVAGMGIFAEMGRGILAEHGISDPRAGQWYSQQHWLDAFKSISAKVGDRTLTSIGRKILESAQWPPAVDSVEGALASIDVAYHMNHRGGEIGSYAYTRTGPRSARMVCRNPYPCTFDRGIIESAAARFKPADCPTVQVKHDDTQPCRANGADSCTYLVAW